MGCGRAFAADVAYIAKGLVAGRFRKLFALNVKLKKTEVARLGFNETS